MDNNDLIKKVDIQRIADEGMRIYEKIRMNYEPRENGKFLAIEVDSGKEFLGDTSAEAVASAMKHYPNKVFYVVKIGFDFVESIARSFVGAH